MINVNIFIKALKISWLRRIVKHSDSISWYMYTLSKISFLNLLSLGQGYANEITKNIDNPFWKDILKNWHDSCNLVEIEIIQNVLDLLFGIIKI